LDVKGKGQG